LIELTLILATFGITDLLTKQNGLFHIFKKWRDYLKRNQPKIGDEADDHDWELYNNLYDAWEHSSEGHLSELFNCHFCLGFWIAGMVAVVYSGIFDFNFIRYWAAIYGGHAIISRMVYRND